jgi:hypothetical protein
MGKELIANSAVPGTEPPIGTLTAALATAAAFSTGTIKTQPVPLPDLQVAGGQYRIRIDSELLLVTAGQTTTSQTVIRGVEGTTPTAHALNAPIYHEITKGALENLAISQGQLPDGVQTTSKPAVTTVAGTYHPDLSNGQRVFVVKATTPLAIGSPVNVPAGTATIAIEVEVEGAEPVTHALVASWLYGSAPGPSVRRFQYFSDDHATWRGIGEEKLPASLVANTGTAPTSGQVPIYTGTGNETHPGTPASSKAEVDSEIAAKAVTTPSPLAVIGTGSANEVLIRGPSAGELTFTAVAGLALEVAMRRMAWMTVSTTAATTIPLGTIAQVTAPKAKLKLPSGTGLSGVINGELSGVQNLSTEAATVEAAFTPGSVGVLSTKTVAPGDTVFYMTDAESTVWIEAWSSRSRAEIEAMIATLALTALPSTQSAGLIAQSFDLPGASAAMKAGAIHIAKIMVPQTLKPKELVVEVTTAGVALTSAFGALYSSSGALIGETPVSEPTQLQGVGPGKMKIKGTPTVVGGPGVFVWGAILAVGGTTIPQLASAAYGGRLRDINTALGTTEVRNGEGRNAANEASYTAMPATLEPANNVGKAADVPFFWMGLK